MITCTLGEKKYAVDFISGRALREMEPAAKMYGRVVSIANAAARGETLPEAENLSVPEALDVMIRWFCILFNNQFTPDDVGNVPRATVNAPLSRSLRRFGILSQTMFRIPMPSTPISTTCLTATGGTGFVPSAITERATQQPAKNSNFFIFLFPFYSTCVTTRKPTRRRRVLPGSDVRLYDVQEAGGFANVPPRSTRFTPFVLVSTAPFKPVMFSL